MKIHEQLETSIRMEVFRTHFRHLFDSIIIPKKEIFFNKRSSREKGTLPEFANSFQFHLWSINFDTLLLISC